MLLPCCTPARLYGTADPLLSSRDPQPTPGTRNRSTVPLPLTARIAVLPWRGGEEFVRRLFEPLGYKVGTEHHPLDEKFPEWGEGSYYTVEIAKDVTLQDLLTHLYVLIPVLDAGKHYWVGQDEVDKLLRHGEGWLQSHPEREAIVSRYLRGFRTLTD